MDIATIEMVQRDGTRRTLHVQALDCGTFTVSSVSDMVRIQVSAMGRLLGCEASMGIHKIRESYGLPTIYLAVAPEVAP